MTLYNKCKPYIILTIKGILCSYITNCNLGILTGSAILDTTNGHIIDINVTEQLEAMPFDIYSETIQFAIQNEYYEFEIENLKLNNEDIFKIIDFEKFSLFRFLNIENSIDSHKVIWTKKHKV